MLLDGLYYAAVKLDLATRPVHQSSREIYLVKSTITCSHINSRCNERIILGRISIHYLRGVSTVGVEQ